MELTPENDPHWFADQGIDEPQVVSFENVDDMWAFIAENEGRAFTRITPHQWVLCDGMEHWFYRIVRQGEPIAIFAHIPAIDDAIANERKCYPEHMDAEERSEFEYAKASLHNKLTRGYVFGDHFSVLEPNGELGTTHVSQVVPITAETFGKAQKAKWRAGRSGAGLELAEAMMMELHKTRR